MGLKISTWFYALIATMTLVGLVAVPSVSAQFSPLDPACREITQQNNELCKESENEDDPLLGNGVLAVAANILSLVAGVIAVIIIIISGIRLITSGGDPAAIGTARNTIIYAAIGLVVIVLARAVVGVIAGGIA